YPLNTPWDMRLPGYRRQVKRWILENSGPSQAVRRGSSSGDTVDDSLFRMSDSRYTGHSRHDQEVTEYGIMFLRHRAKNITSRPWALYLGYLQPHWPYRVPQRYYDMYYPDGIVWPHDARFPNEFLHPALKHFQELLCVSDSEMDAYRRAIAAYYGMVTCLDDLIGKIIEELKLQGIYENTCIIYSSDHGESLGEHGLFYKQCSYEGSAGVPLIIKGPGIPEGRRVDTPVSGVDLYPTLMALAGLETEEDRPGHSLLPLTLGDKLSYPEYAFSEFYGNFFPQSWNMLVKDGYKYTHYSGGMRSSLFNLTEDPHENVDLTSDPAYRGRLREFNDLLYSILNPEAAVFRSKKDFSLIGPGGEDYTKTLSWSEYKEAMRIK
ncbi:MAG: sulfatase-like hydrolase/transferase, partial [Deltaproteobacteria bacterium]|nr:sulfatase-like hydrolase/transferase [Deltaproteobacteria bacterium]